MPGEADDDASLLPNSLNKGVYIMPVQKAAFFHPNGDWGMFIRWSSIMIMPISACAWMIIGEISKKR